MKRQKHTISFRIDDELAKRLDQARAPFGLSRHEWSRGVLTAWLNREEESELNSELIEIRDRLEQLDQSTEQGMSRLLFVILTVGLNVPANDAKEALRSLFA